MGAKAPFFMITKITDTCTKVVNSGVAYYFIGHVTIIVKNNRITVQSNSQRDLLERLTDAERFFYDIVFDDIADKMGASNAEELVEVWVVAGYFTFQQNLADWDKVAGNSKEFIYYSGIEAGNPSGSTSNVKQILFKTGSLVLISQTVSYNEFNQVIKIEAL